VYSQSVVIICTVIGLLSGLGAGVLLTQRLSPPGRRCREAERRLDEVLQEKKAYEDEVVEHFTGTARLLNQLTDSYRQVHNHLAAGAAELCHGRAPVVLERIGDHSDPAEIPADLVEPQPPRDYAPKSSPDEQGMLSEGFGLERTRSETVEEPPKF